MDLRTFPFLEKTAGPTHKEPALKERAKAPSIERAPSPFSTALRSAVAKKEEGPDSKVKAPSDDNDFSANGKVPQDTIETALFQFLASELIPYTHNAAPQNPQVELPQHVLTTQLGSLAEEQYFALQQKSLPISPGAVPPSLPDPKTNPDHLLAATEISVPQPPVTDFITQLQQPQQLQPATIPSHGVPATPKKSELQATLMGLGSDFAECEISLQGTPRQPSIPGRSTHAPQLNIQPEPQLRTVATPQIKTEIPFAEESKLFATAMPVATPESLSTQPPPSTPRLPWLDAAVLQRTRPGEIYPDHQLRTSEPALQNGPTPQSLSPLPAPPPTQVTNPIPVPVLVPSPNNASPQSVHTNGQGVTNPEQSFLAQSAALGGNRQMQPVSQQPIQRTSTQSQPSQPSTHTSASDSPYTSNQTIAQPTLAGQSQQTQSGFSEPRGDQRNGEREISSEQRFDTKPAERTHETAQASPLGLSARETSVANAATPSGNTDRAVAGYAERAVERAESMSDQIRLQGGGEARIRLHDATLGEIRIRVTVDGAQQTSIEIGASHDDVRRQLETRLEDLRQSLSIHKLNVGDLRVVSETASSKMNSETSQQNQNQQQSGQQQATSAQSWNSPGGNSSQSQENPNQPRSPLDTMGRNESVRTRENRPEMTRQPSVQRDANGSLKVRA